jgi:hypothetical protein
MKLARGEKMRQVGAALLHQAQLVGLDGLAQFVVADASVQLTLGMEGRVLNAGNLADCATVSSALGAVV